MKKFIISTDVLRPALNNLSQAVLKNGNVPALDNLLCRAKSATDIELITTDLELTIIHKCQAEITGAPFELLIPFHFIKQIVAFNTSIPLCVELDKGKAKITGQGDVYELGALDKVSDYPALPDMPEQKSIVLEAGFVAWIEKALITVGKEETRPALMHVCIDIKHDIIEMASSDSKVLFTKTFPFQSKVFETLLISQKIAKAISKFESPTVYWRKSHIGFKSGDITVIATRSEHKYADYKAVIPKYKKNLLLSRNELIGALERCTISSSQMKDTSIMLDPQSETVLFEAYDQDLDRKIDVRIPGKYDGPVKKINLSASNFLRLLAQVDYEFIELAIHEPAKAVLLTSETDPAYLGLIMPIAPNQ